MIHRTFRSLDEAPRLVAFTIKQWTALIAGGLAVLGLIHPPRMCRRSPRSRSASFSSVCPPR